MIHPTGRAALMTGVGAPVALVAVLAVPEAWVFGIAYLGAVVALVVADAVAVIAVMRVDAEVDAPPVLHVGEPNTIAVTLAARRAGRVATGIDITGAAGPLAQPEAAVRTDAASVVTLDILPRRRGVLRLDRLWLRVAGPFGLVARTRSRSLGRDIPVMPNIPAVRRAILRFAARDAPLGMKQQHEKGSGTEFDALRDYVPGLDPRAIDWKHSARHTRLVSKEFQTERNHHIVLALDTGHLMSEPIDGIPRLDHAVTALLLLSYVSLHAGDRVGVFAFDARARTFTAPAPGLGTMVRIQHAVAGLDYSAEETNFTLALAELSGRLRRRSLVIVASDFVDTTTAELMVENVARLASRHLVLFVALVDPAVAAIAERRPDSAGHLAATVVAQDMLRERREVFVRLERLGVLCLDAPPGSVGPELINRYIAIKAREMI